MEMEGSRLKLTLSFLSVLSFLVPLAEVQAHEGSLEAYGSHDDRKGGRYHVHRGRLVGPVVASKDAMLRVLKEAPVSHRGLRLLWILFPHLGIRGQNTEPNLEGTIVRRRVFPPRDWSVCDLTCMTANSRYER